MKFENKIVRAGAGAGKTTNLTKTLSEMALTHFESHKKWPRFIVTTFTRKATQELLERLQKLNDNAQFKTQFVERKSYLWVTTIHGILLRFINEYGAPLGLLPGVTLVPENSWGRVHRKILRSLLNGNTEFQTAWSSLIELKSWQEWVSQFQNYFELKLINPKIDCYPWPESSDFANLNRAFVVCADLFNDHLLEKKISQAQVSMSDLEPLSLYMIRKSPELAVQFSGLWDYWFIDEFQDTSPIQKELLWNLSQNQKKYVVGDPQQSIYLFRGAQATLFDQVEKDFSNKNFLSVNYRTQPSLLYFFNSVFTELSSQFRPMEPRSGELTQDPIAKWIVCEDPESELDSALNEVKLALAKGISESEIVILSRSNSTLLKLEKRAKKSSLNIKVTSDLKFYKIPLIREALVCLYCLINPYDEIYFSEMLRTSFFKIDEKEFLHMCLEASKNKTSLYVEAQKKLTTNSSFQTWLASIDGQTAIIQGWLKFLEQHNFSDQINFVDPTGELQTQWSAMVLWIEKAIDSGLRRPLEIVDSLLTAKEIEDLKLSFPPLINKNQVQAMTIHASKGLQFEFVIVVGAAKNLRTSKSPLLLTSESENQWTLNLELDQDSGVSTAQDTIEKLKDSYKKIEALEFDRLAYVALTRAKSKVSLISSGKKDLSWVHRMGLKTEPGIHQTTNFSYEVVEVSNKNSECELAPQSQNLTPTQPEAPPAIAKLNFEFKEKSVFSVSPTYLVEKLIQKSESSESQNSLKKSGVAMLEGLQKANYGTQIHSLMEQFKYKSIERNSKPIAALDFLNPKDWKSFSSVLQSGFAEYGFIVELNKLLNLPQKYRLQGQIDLWGFDSINQEFVIVDYKTGSSQHSEKAFIQMDIYALALKAIGAIPKSAKVNLQAFFLNEKKVMGRNSHDFDSFLGQIREILSS